MSVGGAGDGVLAGGVGTDTLDGDGGNKDMATYESANAGVTVTINTTQSANSGPDAAGDRLIGIEYLRGSRHADSLTGDTVANKLQGGAGADTLDGGVGSAADWVSYERAPAAEPLGFEWRIGAKNPFDGHLTLASRMAPAVADLDADGDLDMVIGHFGGGLLYVKDVNGTWVPQVGAASPFRGGFDSSLYAMPQPVFIDADV